MNVAFKHLSTLLAETTDSDDPVIGLVEKLPDSFKKVIEIGLEEQPEGSYRFKEVRLDSFDAEDHSKYLYRAGGTAGPGVTLTCKLKKPSPKDKKQRTLADAAATGLRKKVGGYLKEMSEKAETTSTREFGKAAFDAIKKDEERVLVAMVTLAEQIGPTKEDAIVTLVVAGPEGRRYPRDVEALKDYFHQRANPEKREQKGMSSVGGNAVCSCCGQHKQRVLCQPETLPYFTFDKPGYVAGGFFGEGEIQKKAWRNFPLCSQCLRDIRRGFKSTKKQLQFRLSGINYLLIPQFADWQSQNAATIVNSLTGFGKKTDAAAQRDQEEIFVHRLSREENTTSFNFWFFRMNQSRMEILSTVENVLPSRMSEIAEAIDLTNKHRLLAEFGDWARAPKIGSIEVNFGVLRDIYQARLKTKGNKPVSRFLTTVQRLAYGQGFDAKEFFDSAMRYIRDDSRRQQSEGREPWLAWSAHRSLAAAFWLINLKLLRLTDRDENENGSIGETMINYPQLNAENLNSRFDEFFKSFGGLFAREEQRACYLMGVLCAQVLSVQRRRFDNRQPFFRNLKDLNLDETEMRGLLPKLKSKLVEYDIDHFNWELEKAIAERFRNAGSPWKLANSEINFFFTLGLSEAPLFSAKPVNKPDPETQEQRL